MFDDPPSLKGCEDGFGDEVGERGSREELNEISLVGSLGEIIGILKSFNYFFLPRVNNRVHYYLK